MKTIWIKLGRQLLVLLLTTLATTLEAAELTVGVADKAPPKALAPAIAGRLQGKCVQLLDDGKPVVEFWFVTELALAQKPAGLAKALDGVKQSTLLGAVNVLQPRRDYRDDELAAGVYTMRLSIQPNDGNHLGTSEYLWFATLVQAKFDLAPDGLADYKSLVKASSKETTTDHPVILSLRPASAEEGQLPKQIEPAPEHKSIRVRVPAKVGAETTSLVFEVVYEGKGHK